MRWLLPIVAAGLLAAAPAASEECPELPVEAIPWSHFVD